MIYSDTHRVCLTRRAPSPEPEGCLVCSVLMLAVLRPVQHAATAGAAQLPAWTAGSCLLEYVPATIEALQAQVCCCHSMTSRTAHDVALNGPCLLSGHASVRACPEESVGRRLVCRRGADIMV